MHTPHHLHTPADAPSSPHRAPPTLTLQSPEISSATLHAYRPLWTHLYAAPFALLYPLLAYAYYVRYDAWLRSEEWTFVACVSLGAGHALSFLVTRWSVRARAGITCRSVRGFAWGWERSWVVDDGVGGCR